MRIYLVLALLFSPLNVFSDDTKSMKELFTKYDSVMNEKKVSLIDEVFTKKFILTSGGKKKLIKKINGLVPSKDNKFDPAKLTWNKGLKGEIYFVKIGPTSSQFIILKENGKFKIDGTLSDDNN